jgi:hypothetical protein
MARLKDELGLLVTILYIEQRSTWEGQSASAHSVEQ